jgi:uncharacterized peroxidase-related enzyme
MTRIAALDPASTTGKTHGNLQAVQRLLGGIPNMFRTAAQSPAVLEALVGMFGATSQTSLSSRVREAIAMTVAEANGCDYCLSAHTALGKGAGLSSEDLDRARDAVSTDPKTMALLRLSRQIVVDRGRVGDAALAAVRQAGANDAEILEVVAIVALNVFTNYLNIVADTEIDFPIVRSNAK